MNPPLPYGKRVAVLPGAELDYRRNKRRAALTPFLRAWNSPAQSLWLDHSAEAHAQHSLNVTA